LSRTDQIEQLLDEMPSWSMLTPEDTILSLKIASYLWDIQKYKTDEIQQAVSSYLEKSKASASGYNTAIMSKLYVLNRFIFRVPEWIESGNPRYASFRGIPQKGEMINELWPLSINSSGDLSITGIFGGYAGESFQALEEFESFNKLYNRRSF
jgi:hypothetical protein